MYGKSKGQRSSATKTRVPPSPTSRSTQTHPSRSSRSTLRAQGRWRNASVSGSWSARSGNASRVAVVCPLAPSVPEQMFAGPKERIQSISRGGKRQNSTVAERVEEGDGRPEGPLAAKDGPRGTSPRVEVVRGVRVHPREFGHTTIRDLHPGPPRGGRQVERVAVAQLDYSAWCQPTRWPVSPPRWLRAVVSWAFVGPSESATSMNGGDVKM